MNVTEDEVLRCVRGKRYRPMTVDELAEKFRVSEADAGAFVAVVEGLKLAGELVEVKGKCLADPGRVSLLVGTLHCNPRGFGFIEPVRGRDGDDVYVHGTNMSSALHGDIVVARVPSPKGVKAKRGWRSRLGAPSDVKIVSVLKRARTDVVGTFVQISHARCVVPDDGRLYRDIIVAAADANGAKNGDKVRVRIETWPSRHINPTGVIEEVFGPRGQLRAERLSVVAAYNLRHEWPEDVLAAAKLVPSRVSKDEIARRTDLRDEQIITIDPKDARDFDDAVSIEQTHEGWEVGVHIADVSHYIRPDDAIDREARQRCTSVYLPGQVIPMLPEGLSNNICSLRPGKVRLTKTVLMTFDRKGKLLKSDVCKSVIRSCRRFTYEEVQAVIEGGKLAPEEDHLRKMILSLHGLSSQLRSRRKKAGMLSLEVPEAHVLADKNGRTTGIELKRGDASHRLIEHFMLAANEAVANYLLKHGLPYICRAHDEPNEKAIREFCETARALGFNLRLPGTRQKIQRLLDRIEDRTEAPALHYMLLRSMKRATYSAEDLPHYAIAVDHYTHFTSPIRRYPDLIAHRILDEYWSGELDADGRREALEKGMPGWAAHCSRLERNAESAERTITLRRMKEWLATQTGPLEALIMSVDSYGMRVQMCESLVEGVVRLSSLMDGFYRVDRQRKALVGPNGRTYKVGDTIQVSVSNFDELKYQIEFLPVDNSGPKRGKARKGGGR